MTNRPEQAPYRDASLCRIVDANLNRAGEALRVAEEVCRFHWNLSGFAAEIKELRHLVFRAVDGSGSTRENLLLHRDIEGDVGRDTPSPAGPGDPSGIAFRNIERAKEALRVLEEVNRTAFPAVAAEFEEIRYRLYAVEKGLGHLPPRGEARKRLARCRLCLLWTQELSRQPPEVTLEQALEAGVDIVQLREKKSPDRKILREGRKLREITARHGVIFVVNDRPDIALLVHADGVHLGQGDLPLAEVRSLVGETLLVGVSTHSLAQARDAERQGADYIGVGPIFSSVTKDAGALLGPEGLQQVLEHVSLPAFAIGGINADRIHLVRRAGGTRIAMSSGILAAHDVSAAVRAVRQRMDGATF